MRFPRAFIWILAAFIAFATKGIHKDPLLKFFNTSRPSTVSSEQVSNINRGFEGSLPSWVFNPIGRYVVVNNNIPSFTDQDLVIKSYNRFTPLDRLGRCGPAIAVIGKEIMPTEPRGMIGMIKPSGWHLVKYEGIDGKYLYNRCHLIAYELTGQNANPLNLITGTRYFNVIGMMPFENKVADFVRRSGKHVMYRVTPVFAGDNLLCQGVLMEAMSVEDRGQGLMFNVFVFNFQPGIEINYLTGDSRKIGV
jgi:DNA-entry nuclease